MTSSGHAGASASKRGGSRIASFASVRRHRRKWARTPPGEPGAFEAAIFNPCPTEEAS